MKTRFVLSIALTCLTGMMFLWLGRMSTSYANLAYGYTLMRLELNQMVDDGAIVIADLERIETVTGIENLQESNFADEFTAKHGSARRWGMVVSGAWFAFVSLVLLSFLHWVSLIRDWRKLKRQQ